METAVNWADRPWCALANFSPSCENYAYWGQRVQPEGISCTAHLGLILGPLYGFLSTPAVIQNPKTKKVMSRGPVTMRAPCAGSECLPWHLWGSRAQPGVTLKTPQTKQIRDQAEGQKQLLGGGYGGVTALYTLIRGVSSPKKALWGQVCPPLAQIKTGPQSKVRFWAPKAKERLSGEPRPPRAHPQAGKAPRA